MAAQTILVTGGTGTVGRSLVAELAHEPLVQVRVLTRNPAAGLPAGVVLHVGNLEDARGLAQAMAGCTRLFLLTSGTRIAQQDALAAAVAVRAGVEHVVKLSALGVGRGGQDPITQWHRAGEQTVQKSGLSCTILRPTGFMSNALDWAYSIVANGTVTAPFPAGRTAVIDPADVARVAAATLTQPGHDGSIYELTGPQALAPAEQVHILAEVLGRSIDYIPEVPATTRARLKRYGMPPDLADAVVALLASAVEPWNAQPIPTVEQIIDQVPSTFRAWAEQHRSLFTAAGVSSR